MKIRETIDRDCCQSKDLKPVEGCQMYGPGPQFKFCVHCGARHRHTCTMDPAGGRDYEYVKISDPLK